MDSARASITSSKNQIKAYTKSMHDFDAGESTTCPTCLQEVHDPEHITNEFLSRIEHLKQTIEDDTSRLKDLNTQSEQYSSSLASLQSLQKELRQIEHDNGVADQASSELIAQMAKEKTLKSDVKTLRRTVSSFAADREKRRNYDSLIKDFKTTTNKINVSSEKLHDIEKSISEMDGKFSERKLESDRKALDRKKDEKTDLVMKLTKKTGDRDLFHEKINSTDLEIQHIKDAIESKRKLLGKLEIASGSASVLSTFREHMILNSIPQITDYASDLIRKITEGKFTDIQIDPKFNMAVSTDDGVERNVMTLSGGELSTVAICMRVAISVMLSGGSPSLMMLDEVLTAMDSDRAEAILNAIQDLNDGQIIIIAHNEIIKSVADSIIEL
jgi:exonuclease SbcC